MNLNTLSSSIDSVILDRGREYVSRGCVRSIEETENGVYVAAVRGSELYEVEESDIVERRIRLTLSPISGQEAVEQCRQLIRSSIRLHSDNHGFVDWRSVDGAVEGVTISVEKSL